MKRLYDGSPVILSGGDMDMVDFTQIPGFANLLRRRIFAAKYRVWKHPDLKLKNLIKHLYNTKGGIPKKRYFLGIFPKWGEGGSPQFPKLLVNYQDIFGMPNSS